MVPRIYTDTSVIGGYFDVEFDDASCRLFQKFQAGKAIFVVSDLTLLELQGAHEQIRSLLSDVPEEYTEEVLFTAEAAQLAEQYISSGIIGSAIRIYARHIATATVNHVTVLVSWNFKHIVYLERIHEYNSTMSVLGTQCWGSEHHER